MNTTLEYLNLFHPCNGVLVVGCGNGSWVDLIASWDAEDVILVEADEKLIERMKKFHTLPREWKVVNALVYKDQTQCEYYHTSNGAASGLEHPDTLSAIWPNLSINSVEVRESVSIPTLLEEVDAQNINWLIIDCTPALKLLQEGESTLHQCDVVVARVLKEEKPALDAWMQEHGLHSATLFEENNPQVVMVVYVKEWHAELTQLQTQNEQTRKELEQKVTELTTQNEEQQNLAKAKLESLEAKLQETQEQKEKEYQEFQATNTKLIERAASVEETSLQLQDQMKQKDEQLLQLQTQNEQTREELEQKVTELGTKQEQWQSVLLEKENRLTQLLQENGEKEKQFQEFKIIIADLETKLNENKAFEHDVYEFKRSKNYYIKPEYQSRTEYVHYDDQACEDEWQLEVYLHALGLMKKFDLKSVVDIGCGSAYKLMHYLSEYDTIGLELDINLEFLKDKYPLRVWLESNFDINHHINTDVVICSDVIEHIVNPDQLIQYIQAMRFKYLVLSTPDRDLVYEDVSKFRDGPPRNPAHVREWNSPEFKDYISQYFEIIDHRVTNLKQSTQTMICKKR